MSMVKIVTSDSYNWNEVVSQLVKVSSRGLVENDLRAFVKRAGHPFADAVRKMEFSPGEVPIHLIAMGASEAFGQNRNGDLFSSATLRRDHPTFVKHARMYRDHQNKDKSKSYGIVKLSMFNEDMKRVELLVALNGTKEAAEKNGGLLADRELSDLESGRDYGVSMATKVPYDVCTGCGNKAPSRVQYCDDVKHGGHCKRGGLKRNLTKVCEDGHQLGADNPICDFFDISRVGKPACHIAYTLGKAASADTVKSGAELAEDLGVTFPLHLLADGCSPDIVNQMKCLQKLAEAERNIESGVVNRESTRAFDPVIKSHTNSFITKSANDQINALKALVHENISVPVENFFEILTGANNEKVAAVAAAVSNQLPGIFNRLIELPDVETVLRTNPFVARNEVPSYERRLWAQKMAADHSIQRGIIDRRVSISTIRNSTAPSIKMANTINPKLDELATKYALYKLAILDSFVKRGETSDFVAEMLALQNYI